MARTTGARLTGTRDDVNRRQKQAVAVDLCLKDWTQEEIARQVGVAQSTVSRWLKAAFRDNIAAGVEEKRAREEARYSRLARELGEEWDRERDIAVARALLAVYERRASLLGLDMPKASGDSNGNGPQTIVQAVHPAWAAAFDVQPVSPVTADGTQAVAAVMPAAIQEGVAE